MLTALAVGCSKELPTVNENAWIYDESLPVPIQFGSLSSEMVTKATVGNLAALSGQPIGVFAWGESSNDSSNDSMETSAKSIFPTTGYKRAEVSENKLVFKEQGAEEAKKVYYPMSSKYNYSFYAYYIGEEENLAGTYGNDKNSYFVNVDFSDPFTDILWGKCSDSDLPYTDNESLPEEERTLSHLLYKDNEIKGFNSRFSRAAAKAGKSTDYLPSIEFQHICSAFSFYAKADNDASMTEVKLAELNDHLKIKSVKITNVPTSAKLVVASKEAAKQGVFDTSATGDVSMNVYDNFSIQKVEDGVILSTAQTGGEDTFFLPPGDYSESQAILQCTLDENEFDLPFALKYTKDDAESTQFEAGKSYSFVVIFKTLEVIQMLVELNEWESGAKTDVDIDDL
mgnify:CR=1 FL=1